MLPFSTKTTTSQKPYSERWLLFLVEIFDVHFAFDSIFHIFNTMGRKYPMVSRMWTMEGTHTVQPVYV